MKNDTVRQAANVVALIATIALNALANILPLNGQATGDISDSFPVFITPAGYVFSVWSLIYVGLIAFAIYQALPSQRENPHLRRIGPWFVASCVANIVWLFLWHYNVFTLTLVAMIALLLSLIIIYLRLEHGPELPLRERLLINTPFSLYLGWITVATIVNVTVVLYNAGFDVRGFDAQIWTAALLVIGAGIAATMAVRRRDAVFALVIVWAFIGIALKHPDTALVAPTAWATAAIALVAAGVGVWRMRGAAPRRQVLAS